MSKKLKNQTMGCCSSPKTEINNINIYIKRDKKIFNTLKKIRRICAYEVGVSLDSAIGRILYDLEMNKNRIKYLKKEYKAGK